MNKVLFYVGLIFIMPSIIYLVETFIGWLEMNF